MNKRMMLLLSSLIVLGLLTACGKSGEESRHASHMEHEEGADEAPSNALSVAIAFASGSASANKETELVVRIEDDQGDPVNKFVVNHEKLLHLIVVNHDLGYFAHLHPEYRGEGEFAVPTTFPAGGRYKAFADFIPEGGSNTTLSEWLTVDGEESAHSELIPDKRLVKTVDGKEIELSLGEAKAGRDVTMAFTIRDGNTKSGIRDLEPYLGAVGHVVILSADAEQYLHVHPVEEQSTGPVAKFSTAFPQAGIYKIWGQFQHRGKVITVPFVVKVK